jgi:D-threo-aldose 1-dehydrogenase
MSTRRDFLNLAVRGSALTAAAALPPGSASAQGNTSDGRSMNNVKDNYKLPFKFGLGGVPIGNEFAVVTDKDAYAILKAAWSAGIPYYDVSPWVWSGSRREKVWQLSSRQEKK